MIGQGSAGKQIDAVASELASARARQDEDVPFRLDEVVHLIEQLGNPLDLVDDDPAGVPLRNERSQVRWVGGQRKIEIRAQEIDEERVREPLSQPGRLSRAAGAEQEEALAALKGDLQLAVEHGSIDQSS